jgi:ABC-2 type transport system permease protein
VTTPRLEDQVGRGLASAGVVVPDGYGDEVAAARPVEVAFVARPDAGAMTLRALVDEAVAEQAAVSMAVAAAADALDTDPADVRGVADTLARSLPEVRVTTTEVGGDELAREFAGLGQFDLGASTQLFLFTFLTSLSGGAALIQTRRLGIASRMLATPAPIAAILLGQAGGRFLVAVMQAVYIVVATVLLFQVDWGPPAITAVVVLLFCAASAGAGMLIGATFRNDSQAGGVGVGLGIGLAALGGSMVPLELFGDGMQVAASITPHAWANRAMAELVRRGGGWADVATELVVLAGFAVGLLGLATLQLRRVLVR